MSLLEEREEDSEIFKLDRKYYSEEELSEFKKALVDFLESEGYYTYAYILNFMNIGIVNNPKIVGYYNFKSNTMVVNKNLTAEEVSMIARHEVLHKYLEHLKQEAEERNRRYDTREPQINPRAANIAMDLEISSHYTDKDHEIVTKGLNPYFSDIDKKTGEKTPRIGFSHKLPVEGDQPGDYWSRFEGKTWLEIYKILEKESPESLAPPAITPEDLKKEAARRDEIAQEKMDQLLKMIEDFAATHGRSVKVGPDGRIIKAVK